MINIKYNLLVLFLLLDKTEVIDILTYLFNNARKYIK